MTIFLSVVTVISIGLMIGVEFAVWAFINPILWKLEKNARSQAVSFFAQKLGTVMPFWYAGNLVLLIVQAVVLRRQPVVWLLAAAAGLWAVAIIISLLFLVPINNRLASPEPGAPLDTAHREHRRWDGLHRARVVILVAAFVLLLIGVHV